MFCKLALLMLLMSGVASGNTFETIDQNSESNQGDYAATIQAALDRVATNGGGTVYVKSGTYNLGVNLNLQSNTHLRGDGIDSTILRLSDNAPSWWTSKGKNAGMLWSTLSNDISITDMTLDGNKKNQKSDPVTSYGRYGIFMDACNNTLYEKVKITNFQGYGFDPHGLKETMAWANDMKILDCISENNDWDGFTIDQSSRVLLKGNVARNNGRHGFNIVTGSKDITLQNNYAIDNGHYYKGAGGCGMTVQSNQGFTTKDIIMRDNVLVNSSRGGVCLSQVQNVSATGNTIAYAPDCLGAQSTTDSSFTSNACMTNETYSIDLRSNITLLDNTNGTLVVPDAPPVPVSTPPIVESPAPQPSSPSPPPPNVAPPSPDANAATTPRSFVHSALYLVLGVLMLLMS